MNPLEPPEDPADRQGHPEPGRLRPLPGPVAVFP